MRHPATFLAFLAVLVAVAGCKPRETITNFAGPTMGTTYQILVADPVDERQRKDIEACIANELRSFNSTLSTYEPHSEISQLNSTQATGWLPVSPLLYEVLEISSQVSAATGGAFDVTIGNLVEAWGFGPASATNKPSTPVTPPAESLQRAAGWQRLELHRTPVLAVRKKDPAIRLDVNGIAPGLAVDRIAAALEKMGFANTLVEIGGEVRGRGRRPDGLPWHVAIEAPVAGERIVYAGVQLLDRAVSTSGDYRDTRVTTSGRRISHTIDPRTGRPIEHGLASVTVVASSAAEADAYATALSVLGSRDGYALARRLGLAVLFLDPTATQGKWRETATPDFRRLRLSPS